jgi:hypothetical protein
MIPEGMSKQVASTTFAVLRATPGSVTSSASALRDLAAEAVEQRPAVSCTDFAFCL